MSAKPSTADISRSFVEYLKEQGLYGHLPEIVGHLQKEAERSKAITVVSALPLTKEEQKELTATLHKRWGQHDLVFTVDSTLMSGLLISFEDQLIDLSGRGRVSSLASLIA